MFLSETGDPGKAEGSPACGGLGSPGETLGRGLPGSASIVMGPGGNKARCLPLASVQHIWCMEDQRAYCPGEAQKRSKSQGKS